MNESADFRGQLIPIDNLMQCYTVISSFQEDNVMTNFTIENVGKVCPPNQYAWEGGVLHC